MSRAVLAAALLLAVGVVPMRAEVPERDRYHNAAQMESLLKSVTGVSKRFAKLHAIGKSFEGRTLWAVEVTDFTAGKADEKPGVLLAAGLQGDEPGASEIAVQILSSVLDRAGKDAAVTELLKNRVLYIVPRLNPDGVERMFAKAPMLHRNTAEPLDDDNDGVDDEDRPQDVDGDGLVLQMRTRDAQGEWTVDSNERRLLTRRKPGDPPGEWRLFAFEGRDVDGDGLVAEDGLGGTNLNRNFPALWDWRTKQSGAGPFMASAPETVAMLEFTLSHPNIALVEALHVTGGQPVLPAGRLGASPAGQDKAVLDGIVKKWEEATLNKAAVSPPDPADPGAGTFLDWAYLHFGALAVSPEIWNAPQPGRVSASSPSPNPPPATGEKAWLEWNDRDLAGEGFVPWKPFKHPQLGDVEIGGWKPFTRDNPPAKYLAPLAEKDLAFFLSYAEMTPDVKITDVKVEMSAAGVYQVLLSVTNAGKTPTATAQGILNRQTRPVLAILDLPAGAKLVSGITRLRVGHLDPGATRTVAWTITAPAGTKIKLTTNAQRGGTDEREVVLK